MKSSRTFQLVTIDFKVIFVHQIKSWIHRLVMQWSRTSDEKCYSKKRFQKPKLRKNHQKYFFMFYLQLLDKILFNNVVVFMSFFMNWKSSHPFHEAFNIFRRAFILSKFNQLEKRWEDKEINDCNIFTSAKWFSFKTCIQISKKSIRLLDSVFRCFWATETTVDLKRYI